MMLTDLLIEIWLMLGYTVYLADCCELYIKEMLTANLIAISD